MSVDKTEAIKAIQTLYGLAETEAEKKLATLSDAEISKLISNYKKDLDMGVSVQKSETCSVFLADYDNQTYTDNNGNTITEYFDGENVVERIIKDKDGNSTTVTYRNNRPLTQIKNIQGNIEKSKFEYHDDADEPYVTVETTKADKTKVTTNTQGITENGDIIEDYIKDRKTVKPDGTTTTLTPKIIDLKSPTNDKKTFFKGEVMEEVVETFNGKKRTTYFEGSSFGAQGRRVLTQTADNTVYYNAQNKPVYNHKEYIKKQNEELYKKAYEQNLQRSIPLKGTHTNVLSNNVTLGKNENVTVKEFITNILGIDINSETGKKLAERFVMLPDEELQKISYADYEAQTLGMGKFAQKTNDYSGASFEKIARDLRQKSGVNIETQDEITQHRIRMQVEERALQNRKKELGIDANNFAKESLAAVYEQAAGMLMQDRNRTMNPLDPKDYAHFAKNIGTAFLDNASMGLLGKDAFHQASDYEDFAEKIRNLPADSSEEFAREYEKLTGQKYDIEKVKGFMEFLNKSNLDKMDDNKRAEFLKSDKYKSEFAKAFGFRATENTEKQLGNENTAEELIGIVGDVYLLAQTGGLSSMKTLVSSSGKLTGKMLSKTPLSKKAVGIISETAARATGGSVSMAGLTTMKSVSENIVYDEIDATDFDTWKNTAIGIGESGVLGAVGGVVGKMAEPVVKYIEKPAEREAQAMLKALSSRGEMSAKELMQTVSKESGVSLDGLFKMNKEELVQLIRTTAGKGFEITAEAGAFGVTEAVMDDSDKSFSERLEEQYEMLTKMKGASKLVQMITAGKAGKAALINSSKVLNETKIKPTKTPDGKTQFELTLPNGKKIITENPDHALATCNYLMQAELVEQSAKEEQAQIETIVKNTGSQEINNEKVRRSYDSNGNINYTDKFDENNRLIEREFPDESYEVYQYGDNGKLSSVTLKMGRGDFVVEVRKIRHLNDGRSFVEFDNMQMLEDPYELTYSDTQSVKERVNSGVSEARAVFDVKCQTAGNFETAQLNRLFDNLSKNSGENLNGAQLAKFIDEHPELNLEKLNDYIENIDYNELYEAAPNLKSAKTGNLMEFFYYHARMGTENFNNKTLSLNRDFTEYLTQNYVSASDMEKLMTVFPNTNRDVGSLPEGWSKTNNSFINSSVRNAIEEFRTTTCKHKEGASNEDIQSFKDKLSNILQKDVQIKFIGSGCYGAGYKISVEGADDVVLKIFHEVPDMYVSAQHGKFIEPQTAVFVDKNSNAFTKFYFGRIGTESNPDGYIVSKYESNANTTKWNDPNLSTNDNFFIGATDVGTEQNRINDKIIDYGGLNIRNKRDIK